MSKNNEKQLKESLIGLLALLLKYKDDKEFKKLLSLYKQHREELKEYIGKVYLKYIKNNNLTMTYTDINKEIKKLESKLKSIGNDLKKQEDLMLGYYLLMAYKYTYFKGTDIIGGSNKKPSDETIKDSINKKIDGKSNAQRNKLNKEKFINKIKNDIKKDFKGKKSIEIINKNIDEDFNIGANASDKLLSNEIARVFTAALMQGYEDNNISEVEWVSAMEKNTCSECEGMNGEVFDINEAPIPILDTHVGCLCMLIPVLK